MADIGDVKLGKFFMCLQSESTEYFEAGQKRTRATPIFVFTCITKTILGACFVFKRFELLLTVLARHKLFGQYMTSLGFTSNKG